MGKFWGRIVEKAKKFRRSPFFPKPTSIYPQVFPKRNFQNIWREIDFSTGKLPTILVLLFSFIILVFPNNLAKHFVLPQSYVLGLLIDYLSPAIYLTEILVALLLLFSMRRLLKQKLKQPRKTFLILAGIFLMALLPSVWQGATALTTSGGFSLISLWRWLELALWLGFGFWVATFISKKGKKTLVLLLGIAVGWVSLLALGQFLTQHSLLGYWFMGEPNLSPSLGGVALGSWGGREVLRAYGTFPHPNVLGGILSVVLVWLAARKRWFGFGVGFAAVVASLSRTAWVSLAGGLTSLLSGFHSFLLWGDLSFSRRWELLESAGRMISSSPLAGVGLGQFTSVLPEFGLPSGLSLFIQPAHNIFALIAAESGIPALLAFLFLLAAAFRQTLRQKNRLMTIALLQLVFLGFFDHYLYTSPQGLFLFSLIMGLSFSYSDN